MPDQEQGDYTELFLEEFQENIQKLNDSTRDEKA
jgi:hypothetical protein